MKKLTFLVLGLIMLAGLLLRLYNINFPSIGYHNMKENEYLSMAEEMERTGDFVTRRIYFYDAFEENPVMRLYPQPPLVSYQILLAWRLLGENLWGPRLFNVFFGVMAILVMYLVGRLLFRQERAALLCGALLAVMPLAVFFSRNLQPESPAFFFMLLGVFWYLRFAQGGSNYNLLLGGVSFSIAWLYKFSFLFGVLPCLACLPYRRIFASQKGFLRFCIAFVLPYSLIAAAVVCLMRIGQWEFQRQETLNRIRLLAIFGREYWARYGRMIWWYVRGENFTLVYTALAAAGLFVACAKRRGLLNRYLIGSAVSLVAYCMVFSDHVNQHNYYQMPFLPMVCLASVSGLIFAASAIEKLIHKNVLAYLGAAVIAISGPDIYNSLSRMHGTVFYGADVAGESLKEFTKPGDRVFLLTYAQGYGIARYARRYAGWTDDLARFREYEEKFNIRYVCFYPAEFALGLKEKNPGLFEHIVRNYHVKEAGMVEAPNKIFYIILERGEGSDPKDFLMSFSGSMRLRTIYNVLGKLVFFYALQAVPPGGSPPQEAAAPPS